MPPASHPATPTSVVVGAASGMGRAVAELFAGQSRLVLADRNAEAVAAVAAELPAGPDGAPVEALECDVTDPAAVGRVAAAAGPFRSLVVTAGLSPTMAPAARIYDVNLRGTALVLEHFAPLASTGSAAVCFASTAGHLMDCSPYWPVLDEPLSDRLLDRLREVGGDTVDDPAMAYMLSKAGVMRLVRRSAMAWGHRGARLVSVSPGIIDTPMGQQEMAAQAVMSDMVAATPLQRQGAAREVARVAHFLCSDDASFVSGCDLLVDGGWVGSAIG